MKDLTAHFHYDINNSEKTSDWYTTTAKLPLPILNNLALSVDFHTQDISLTEALPSLAELSGHGTELRAILAKAIHGELIELAEILVEDAGDYSSIAEMLLVNGVGRGFDDLSPPRDANDIWRLVRWKNIGLDRAFESDALNVIVCGELAWEVEHEIGLFFRDGAQFLLASDPSYTV
jgi:hypothetical protein